MEKYFPDHHFASDKDVVYLGSESNPKTGREYDYYLSKHYVSPEIAGWIAVHGSEDHEYGSSRLSSLPQSFVVLRNIHKDFLFGIIRAEYFCLMYLALGVKPLLGETEVKASIRS